MSVYDDYKEKTENLVINKNKSKTPTLDQFSRNLTALAESGLLDPIIGRDSEMERISQILARKKKNNPVLIGEPGVGKSAIVEGLALRIVAKKVPVTLFKKRLLSLDMGAIVAGTKYRGEFESRIQNILEELRENKDTIIFIDEIHTIVGAGGSSDSLDAANMFKPALARGEIQCIGSTTFNEYRQTVEKDGALERRFQKVKIDEPDFDTTLSILKNVKCKYEEHHNVTFTDEAIYNCVKLTERYINDRRFPDKALDALDEAGSRSQQKEIVIPENIKKLEKNLAIAEANKIKYRDEEKYKEAGEARDQALRIKTSLDIEYKLLEKNEFISKTEIVNGEKILEVVSMMSGIPLNKISQKENEKLVDLEKDLKAKVIGQDYAISKIAKAIRRSRTGLKDPNRPIGSFMLSGPTGVGKTLLARELADIMFGDPEALIRIDMSEYMEKFEVSKLIGAPPGYIGHGEGGQLTEKVRIKPYSIVLFDEIEKAHPDIFNILLQILDEGRITDSLGKKIDFKNTLILMTSNIGQRKLQDSKNMIGFDTSINSNDDIEREIILKKELEKAFAPEFINRIDDIIHFRSLDTHDTIKIIDIELNKMIKRTKGLGYNLVVEDDLKKKIAEIGFDDKYGARPIKRVIQKYIEDSLADLFVHEDIEQNSTLTLTYDSNKNASEIPVNIKVTKAKKRSNKKIDENDNN